MDNVGAGLYAGAEHGSRDEQRSTNGRKYEYRITLTVCVREPRSSLREMLAARCSTSLPFLNLTNSLARVAYPTDNQRHR